MIKESKYQDGTSLSIIFLFILAGIDGFQLLPLFKELGARPFFLIYMALIIFILLKNKLIIDVRNLILFLSMLFLSSLGFLLYGISISEFGGKEPSFQFISHFILFFIGISPFILKTEFFFQSPNSLRSIFVKALLVNILFILIDFIFIYFYQVRIFEEIFTVPGDRYYPTGLFSEPSYFAAYFAIMIPTILYNSKPITIFAVILIASLFFFFTGIRTFFPIFIVGIFALIYYRWGISIKMLILMPIIFTLCFYILVSLNIINVDANLSSAYRLGNIVSFTQYSFQNNILLGYGFGSAHFVYPLLDHPNFMTFSQEFRNAISGNVEMRIPVFNLYVRMFIEIGMLGTLIFITMIFVNLSSSNVPNFLKVFIWCALTQSLSTDSYIYGMLTIALVFLYSNFHFMKNNRYE